jgi:hypothetical protein
MNDPTAQGRTNAPAQGDAVIGYESATPQGWDTAVTALIGARDELGVALVGPCPRCGHTIRVRLDDIELPAYSLKRQGLHTVPAVCNCSVRHPGADPDTIGCGAYGGIVVEF